MRAVNLTVKFFLELAAFAGLAVWGWHAGNGRTSMLILLALVAPAVAIALWALLAAPRASRRLPLVWRAPFELGVFLIAGAALAASGHSLLAAIFLIVVVGNAVGLTVLRQWEF